MNDVKDISFLEKALSPMGGGLTFVFLLIASIVFIVWLFRDEIKVILKKPRKRYDYNDLKYHNVFTIASNFPNKVNKIDFTTSSQYDAVKTKLIQELLKLKSASIHKYLNNFLERDDLDTMNPNRLRHEFSKLLSNMIKEYNQEALTMFTERFNISRLDAKYLIDKYEEYRYYLVEGFTESVENISTDDYIESNFMKINSIFYLIGLSLDVIPNDVVRVFNDVNGRFRKYDEN